MVRGVGRKCSACFLAMLQNLLRQFIDASGQLFDGGDSGRRR
jgi:hypothetical protein